MALHNQPEWREKMRVRFDFNCAMAPAIGEEHGLTEDDIGGLSDRIRQGHDSLRRKRQAGDLAWMELPYAQESVKEILGYVDSVAGRFDDFVVLGIGGSALGNTALSTALNPPYYNVLPPERRHGRPRLFVLDNVDPDQFAALMELIDLGRALFNVITKSGSTSETMAQYLIVRKLLIGKVGPRHQEHLVATTDPVAGELRKLAEAERYRTFSIPPGVGGRFSVLSPVGLLSAAMTGIDVSALLAGAAYADKLCSEPDVWRNPSYMNAAIHYLGYERGRTLSVMMPYAQALKDVADWYAQLWAESLGKKRDLEGNVVNVGPTPIKALGVTDQHSQVQLYTEGRFDKIVNFVAVERFQNEVQIPAGWPDSPEVNYLGGHTLNELMKVEREGTALALAEAGRPSVTFTLPEVNAFTVGQLLFMLEVQTAAIGELFRINAFDQPGVEAGKIAAYALMGRVGYEARRQEIQAGRKSSPKYVI
ncbi:MAG TPA: glucose-6-phosphate isomerase [Chloroflexota bacterium]|jgi:glucose-6-phosphate isomerase|nr:glucose-6-phosphate isomerase [Chloroflexota bacterium]